MLNMLDRVLLILASRVGIDRDMENRIWKGEPLREWKDLCPKRSLRALRLRYLVFHEKEVGSPTDRSPDKVSFLPEPEKGAAIHSQYALTREKKEVMKLLEQSERKSSGKRKPSKEALLCFTRSGAGSL